MCRPGQAADPCESSLTATVLPASGPTTVEHTSDAADPPIDCFYVYPTVSPQPGILANLHIDPAETSVAEAQASRFSEDCKVYAPVYPQLTLRAITDAGGVTLADLETAYKGVAAAWDDYLAHYNDGRGVVVIGHSQGAAMLIALLRLQVDHDAAVRSHLVSAIILGGNVTVPIGKDVGGSFENIPSCRSFRQVGCVVAYSSFDTQPPADSLFGRPGAGVSILTPGPKTPTTGMQVLCVDPARPRSGPRPAGRRPVDRSAGRRCSIRFSHLQALPVASGLRRPALPEWQLRGSQSRICTRANAGTRKVRVGSR